MNRPGIALCVLCFVVLIFTSCNSKEKSKPSSAADVARTSQMVQSDIDQEKELVTDSV